MKWAALSTAIGALVLSPSAVRGLYFNAASFDCEKTDWVLSIPEMQGQVAKNAHIVIQWEDRVNGDFPRRVWDEVIDGVWPEGVTSRQLTHYFEPPLDMTGRALWDIWVYDKEGYEIARGQITLAAACAKEEEKENNPDEGKDAGDGEGNSGGPPGNGGGGGTGTGNGGGSGGGGAGGSSGSDGGSSGGGGGGGGGGSSKDGGNGDGGTKTSQGVRTTSRSASVITSTFSAAGAGSRNAVVGGADGQWAWLLALAMASAAFVLAA
ncbi:hypothetical protein OC842_005086 [Tilletia horrida]|uniref:Uncharacterized protein n=1 Tax=Tilletia horrida TaxID=155126 RepID=A0AAN6G8G6_9BASI|nr:hypothetical protein OC842_005086 [Tilletia horrida]